MTERREKPASSKTRRDFIKKTIGAAAAVSGAAILAPRVHGRRDDRKVTLVLEPDDATVKEPPVRWAVARLEESLGARGVRVDRQSSLAGASPEATCVLVAGPSSRSARRLLEGTGLSVPDAPEALGLVRGRVGERRVLLAQGSDARGLVYGLLELEDRVAHSPDAVGELERPDRIVEQPANPVRSIARLFTSDVEDKAWFHDKSFWERYLSTLMAQRFNRFTLTLGLGYNSPRRIRDSYFYFAYPFLVSVPGYDVRATGVPDEERRRNLEMLRWISEQTTARGLHFQLALWTHAYRFRDSPDANHVIEGLTPRKHAAYCRDALHTLLEACPAIAGLTFRCHSESGVPEGSYDFWRTVYDGVVRAGRKRPIDIHSKGIDHKLLGIALETGMPVSVSPKYWAEHMGLPYHQAAIRDLEFARHDRSSPRLERQRRFTRYGYADYLREDRRYGVLFRLWPGTQRLLLWGDPALAAGYGRHAHFCGSLGLELCEPLSFKGRMGSGVPGSRNAYAEPALEGGGGDWEKHLYTYRLWGRMLYNPDTPRDCWGRFLTSEFGAAARDCEVALGNASRVLPLITTAHDPSASNNSYWPEIYTNMPIVSSESSPYRDTPTPRRFGTVSPLDPALFSRVEEFVDEMISGTRTGKYTPLDVARWLDRFARTAESRLARARKRVSRADDPAFRRLAVDVTVEAGLGRFFAEKLRAASAYAYHEKTGDRAALKEAIRRYRAARDAWAELARAAKGVYVDDITFGRSAVLRGHWADRLAAIDEDVAAMEDRAAGSPAPAAPRRAPSWTSLVADLRSPFGSRRPPPRCQHLPPASFRPGEPVPVEMAVESGHRLASARLHYRHVNQADEGQVQEMVPTSTDGRRRRAVIPGEYTRSPYPLMYYFELHDALGDAWLHPGFDADLANQPYFVVQGERSAVRK
ncbi:MAG: twin-arginine translocation signal domain-containing protein [Planctomycetota bacterium]|nr:twin-arginine translocation signal domain-containing protein [Planctomycetota bacterium]